MEPSLCLIETLAQDILDEIASLRCQIQEHTFTNQGLNDVPTGGDFTGQDSQTTL